jgi:uncharacterized protein (TIGR02147 family)
MLFDGGTYATILFWKLGFMENEGNKNLDFISTEDDGADSFSIQSLIPATPSSSTQELKISSVLEGVEILETSEEETIKISEQITTKIVEDPPKVTPTEPQAAAAASDLRGPDLSDYMDFRKYLQDFYDYKKAATANHYRPYNYQAFSAAADIKSPNYLKMIIDGQRNLSEDMIQKFAKALALNKAQGLEFKWLVLLNQASDPAERNLYLKKLTEQRFEMQLKSGQIDRKTWEKIPNWVTWVVYALVDQAGVPFDGSKLKEILRGRASEDQIQHAIESLISSGELQRRENGELVKARSMMESAEDVPVALVRKLQMQLMYLGLESLYQDEPTEREFGTLTLSLTRQEFEEIKFKLRQMRKSIHKDNAIARMKEKGERVYQLNLQLFPVTNPSESKN